MDLIDREQAIKLLNLNKPNVDEKTKYAMWQFDKDIQTIKTMPSAEKIGKWEYIGGYGYQYRCSTCIMCAEHKTRYCPNCGSRMW